SRPHHNTISRVTSLTTSPPYNKHPSFSVLLLPRSYRPARLCADLIGGFLQRLALARDEGDAAAFARQRRRASPAEPLACAAYERGLAANFQIHDFSERVRPISPP